MLTVRDSGVLCPACYMCSLHRHGSTDQKHVLQAHVKSFAAIVAGLGADSGAVAHAGVAVVPAGLGDCSCGVSKQLRF